jgi:hypothetical protein
LKNPIAKKIDRQRACGVGLDADISVVAQIRHAASGLCEGSRAVLKAAEKITVLDPRIRD